MNYYNEFDPYPAQWLRNLSAAGHIISGTVDQRSITEVRPDDLKDYTQCHFFAGIGVWSYALRLAGWPDDVPVWTGSCPCQPFSAAGRGGGFTDERHLWPEWFRLIRECRPPVIFGEQVASKDGLAWLDLVYADLEGAGYAVGASDLCAAGVGAPHMRQRLYFVAYAVGQRWGGRREGPYEPQVSGCTGSEVQTARPSDVGGMAHTHDTRLEGRPGNSQRAVKFPAWRSGVVSGMDIDGTLEGDAASPTNGYWGGADWLLCRDNKWRPVEPGLFPLAHGASERVGRLRAYGNAIVAPLAAEFIRASMEALWEKL